MTHAIFNGNLHMIKFLFENCDANAKKIVRVPGLYSTNEVNKLFPFYVALAAGHEAMFDYFWNEQGKLNWNEDTFETLFNQVAKREASHIIPIMLRSKTTHSLYLAMTYSYRDIFIERLLAIEDELLGEITSMVKQYKGESSPHKRHHQASINNHQPPL